MRPVIQTICMDELLYGTPSWEKVVDFFQHGEFDQEHYLVAAIEKHLQTEEQRKAIFDARLSIEKMLNGRYADNSLDCIVPAIFADWNAKLGFNHFGH